MVRPSEIDTSGVLGTPRARQLARIGNSLENFMSEELLELITAGAAEWAGQYSEDLGNNVKRTLRVTQVEDGTIDLEVRLTGYREPAKCFQVTLRVSEVAGG